ncbi:probable cytochrome P450 6a14 [Ochlerotatus camptorhynchus]|uniref:probable cytochrome P450 6a14 n=1 Tax=Ochlerotatus camptorhynchus TaxID=644619 RepID=UPI0031DAE7A0
MLLKLYLAVGITLVLALAAYLFLFLNKRRTFWKDRNFPCTGRAQLVYGDYKNTNQTEHMQDTNQRLYREFKARKLSIGGTILFIIRSAIVVDPDLIKAILVKDFNFFHDRGIYNNAEADPMSGHLFSLEGQAWRQLRAKLSPTFTSGKMKMMFSTILRVADDLKEFLLENTANGAVELEMKNVLAGFTTDVIGSCAFGIECNSLRATRCQFREVSRKIFDQSVWQMLWMIVLMTFKGVATAFKLKATPAEVEQFFTKMVRETIEHRERNHVQRNDFMNLLIQMKNSENLEEKLTQNEITAQSFIFFVAGFETSSTTMVNCLFELAMNPDIQEKLRSEISKACGDGPLTYESVSSVEYLNMVIDETLRKYPTVDSLMRTASKNYQIPDSDLKIPEGTLVFIPTYAIHHDPEYYPEPERFDPERFNAENRTSRHPFVFLPFGEGPRNCIGMRFGLMQTRVGLITVLRQFRVRPSDNTPSRLVVDPKSGIPTPLGGVPLLIERI